MKLYASLLGVAAISMTMIAASPVFEIPLPVIHDHEDRDISCNPSIPGQFPLRWDDCQAAIDQFGVDYPHPYTGRRRDRWVIYYNDPRPDLPDWPPELPPPKFLKLPHSEIKGTCNFTIERVDAQARPYDLSWLDVHDDDGAAVIGYCRAKSDHGGGCTHYWGSYTTLASFTPFVPTT